MAPQAQFFSQPVNYGNPSEENAANYAQTQKMLLNSVFSRNLDAKGNLNESGFYQDAVKAGINPDEAMTAMKYHQSQLQNDVMNVGARNALQYQGANPDAGGRNGASVGEPAITTTPAEQGPKNPLVPAAAPSPDGQAQTGTWFDQLKAKTQQATPDQTPSGDSQPDNRAALARLFGMKDANGQDLGASTVQGSSSWTNAPQVGQLPELSPQPQGTISQAPDTRSHAQLVEDSARGGTFGQMGQGTGTPPPSLLIGPQTPPQVRQSVATTLALKKYDNDGSDQSINGALGQYFQDRVAAVGPPPFMAPMKDGQPDYAALMNQQREWQGKVAGVAAEIHQDLGAQYADQFSREMSAAGNNRAQVDQSNTVLEKNAAAAGGNQFAGKVTQIGKEAGLPGNIDPTSFKSKEEMDAFGKQATAYSEMQKMVKTLPPDGFKDPLQVVNFAKNYTQAEGLGEAEGTRNLVTLLSTSDPAARVLLSGVMGKGEGAVNQVVTSILMTYRPADLAKLSEGMKFQSDWQTHTGTGALPSLSTGGQQVQPFQQKPPEAPPAKTLANTVAAPGTKMNPIPEGKEPPVGAWYMYKGNLIQRKK